MTDDVKPPKDPQVIITPGASAILVYRMPEQQHAYMRALNAGLMEDLLDEINKTVPHVVAAASKKLGLAVVYGET